MEGHEHRVFLIGRGIQSARSANISGEGSM